MTLTVESSGDLSQWEIIVTSHLGGAFTGIAGISGETAGTAPPPVQHQRSAVVRP